METLTPNILDATQLAPAVKHSTIFARIAELQDGQSFILHNDHDPKPLYYQLQAEYGNTYSWEYLEEGPEWWKVRIGKRTQGSNRADMNILDATQLAPPVKHSTIFARIAELKDGESFMLHNDHDPKPLHYHLQAEYGDTYSWEYVEEGPEWWKVKIAKRATMLSGASENILDVTKLEPRVKHSTIFERYHVLNEGTNLTIHNDHDPKPLYYQMLGELGNVFIWEYLEEGPEWWKVKITKRISGEGDETLGEIAVKDLRKAEVFKKYGLDFSCGGKKTVKEACAEKGLDVTKVEQELQRADKAQSTLALPYNDWSLEFLADFIVNTHHSYLLKNLPDIRKYAEKVMQVHGQRHPELNEIHRLVEAVNAELIDHMAEEVQTLFPWIKQLVAAKSGGPAVAQHPTTFGEKVKAAQSEHVTIGKHLEALRANSKGYTVPSDGCASYTLLYRMLSELETDVRLHIHLENNILFPKATELERSLK